MTPALKQRIQDVAVGAVAGALAVGLTIWRDVSVLKEQHIATRETLSDVKKDLGVLSQFFQSQYPGWVGDLTTPKSAPSREP